MINSDLLFTKNSNLSFIHILSCIYRMIAVKVAVSNFYNVNQLAVYNSIKIFEVSSMKSKPNKYITRLNITT